MYVWVWSSQFGIVRCACRARYPTWVSFGHLIRLWLVRHTARTAISPTPVAVHLTLAAGIWPARTTRLTTSAFLVNNVQRTTPKPVHLLTVYRVPSTLYVSAERKAAQVH